LAIQSTIPSEVSDLSQELLRQARAVPFSEYKVPAAFPGFGGSRVQVSDLQYDVEEVPCLGVIQGIVLLHLKAGAIVVREAQCCSSSDSSASDSSLSSHGSRCDRDARVKTEIIKWAGESGRDFEGGWGRKLQVALKYWQKHIRTLQKVRFFQSRYSIRGI
jgi:hypothetical protein